MDVAFVVLVDQEKQLCDYYIGCGDINQNPDMLLFVGDKVDYDAESFTRSLGMFFQAEHNKDAVNAYVNLSLAMTGYNRIDLFNYSVSENIGKLYGPQSIEVQDLYLRLDQDLSHLIRLE